jgi:hypothetical protein
MVLTVRRTSPAEKAGLMRGDFILTITGNSVYTFRAAQVQKMLDNLAGKELKLYIARPDPIPKNEQERRRALIILQAELNKEKEKKVDTSAFQSSYNTAMDDIGALLNDLGPIPVSRTPKEDKTGYSSSEDDVPPSKRSSRGKKKSPSPLAHATTAVGDGMFRFGHEDELESPAPSDDDGTDDDLMNDPLFDFNTQEKSGVCFVTPKASHPGRDFSLDDFTDILGDIRKDSERRIQEKKKVESKQPVLESTVAEYEPSFVHKKKGNVSAPQKPNTTAQSTSPVSQGTPISVSMGTVSEENTAELVKLSPSTSNGGIDVHPHSPTREGVDGVPLYAKVNKPKPSPEKKTTNVSRTKPSSNMVQTSDPPDLVVVEPKIKKSGSSSSDYKREKKLSNASSNYDDFAALFPSTDDFFLPETTSRSGQSESEASMQMDNDSDNVFDPGYAVVGGRMTGSTSPSRDGASTKPSSEGNSAPQNTKRPRKPSYSPPPVPTEPDEMDTTPPAKEPVYDVVIPRHPVRSAPKLPLTAAGGKDKSQQRDSKSPSPVKGKESGTKNTANKTSTAEIKKTANKTSTAEIKKTPQGKSSDRSSGQGLSRNLSPKPSSPPPPVPTAYDKVTGMCLEEDPSDPGYATVHQRRTQASTTAHEPGYAEVRTASSQKTSTTTTDPGYAEVRGNSPDDHAHSTGKEANSQTKKKKASFYDEVEYDDFSDFVTVQDEVEKSTLPETQTQPKKQNSHTTKPSLSQTKKQDSHAAKPSSSQPKSKKENVSDLIVPLQDLGIGKPQQPQTRKKREHLYDEIQDPSETARPHPSSTTKPDQEVSIPSDGSKRTSGKDTRQQKSTTHRAAPRKPTQDNAGVSSGRENPPVSTVQTTNKDPHQPPAPTHRAAPKSPPQITTSAPQDYPPVTNTQTNPLKPGTVSPSQKPSAKQPTIETSTDVSSLEKGTSSSKLFFWKKKRAISQKDTTKSTSEDDGVMLKGYRVTNTRDYSGEMYSAPPKEPSGRRTSSPVQRTDSPSSVTGKEKAVTSHDLKQRRRLSVQGQLELTCKTPEASTEGLPFPVQEWDSSQVQTWLRQLNDFLYTNYNKLFKEHQITGRSLLRIQDYQLTQMGIDNQKHRSVLTSAISRLKIYQAGLDLKQMSSQ